MKILLPKCFQPFVRENEQTSEEQVKRDYNHFDLLLNQTLIAIGPLLLTISSGTTLGFSAILIPQLRSAENSTIVVNKTQVSWIASMAVLPMAFGSVIGGILLNRIGRKTTHSVSCFPIFSGWLLIFLANSINIIFIGRFVTGFFTGVLTTATGVYIGETSEPSYRGFLLAAISFSVAFGLLLVHLLGTFYTWQTTALVCLILPLVSQIVIYFTPESPVWLAEKGKAEEAKAAFLWCRGSSEEAKIEMDLMLQRSTINNNDKNQSLKEKFSEFLVTEFLKPLMIIIMYVTTKQWSGINAIAFYSVTIMKNTVGDGVDEYLATLLVDLIRLFMATVTCFLIKKFKRRQLAIISGIGTVLSLLMLSSFIYGVKIYPSLQIGYIPVICLICYIIFVSMGIVPLPNLMSGELFSPKYKGLGCGISSFIAFWMFFSVVKCTPRLFENYGPSGSFLIFGSVSFVGTIFVYFFLPETKGKSLHEIENIFKSNI